MCAGAVAQAGVMAMMDNIERDLIRPMQVRHSMWGHFYVPMTEDAVCLGVFAHWLGRLTLALQCVAARCLQVQLRLHRQR